jgi:starch synthase (maltosyl-transferring)
VAKPKQNQIEHDSLIGRLPITSVTPAVDGGAYPAKAFVGEVIPFSAIVFREGHDALGVELILTSPTAKVSVHRMQPGAPGSDSWHTVAQLTEQGAYRFQIRAFGDDYETWHHSATVKIAVGADEDLMMLEGVNLFAHAAAETDRSPAEAKKLIELAEKLGDKSKSAKARLAEAESPQIANYLYQHPIRSLVTLSDVYTIKCEREYAGSAAWYEFFPRSEGAVLDPKTKTWTSGNFKTAAKRLVDIAAMGFQIVYLPPIHPIGTAFRKGPNNSLKATANDPGSPWAIGNTSGGHDAVHPDLGTQEDFVDFVKKAKELGLEIALDLALQASPDHPWVKTHPEWFTTRADGTIAYAENPPKKYQDIYPINFDNDRDGIYLEVLRVVKHWISLGVRVFRVDNPHTKPVNFWQWLIAEVNSEFDDVIFLAEAFTRPAMMHTLAKVGFQQSYTYFTWRNTKAELESYLTELSRETADFFRPNLWVSTPDILTEYLQFGGPAGHKIRAIVASMAGSSWGMYSGFELIESVARPGAEEHIDSEKYEYKPRDFKAAEKNGRSIAGLISQLNQIRADHPAIRQLRNLELHASEDNSILVFSKHLAAVHNPAAKDDTLIIVVNVDPHSVRETTVHLDLGKLAVNSPEFEVHDLLSGQKFTWHASNYVRLDPREHAAHILHITKKN